MIDKNEFVAMMIGIFIGLILLSMVTGQSWTIRDVGAAASTFAVLIALRQYIKAQENREKENNFKKISDLLSHAENLLLSATSGLKDENNDSYLWKKAASDIAHSAELENNAKSLSNDESRHLIDIFLSKKMAIAHNLYEIVSLYDKKLQKRHPKPVSFFLGIEDWENFIDDPFDAARKVPDSFLVCKTGPYDPYPAFGRNLLNETSVKTVFSLLMHPIDYKDPINYLKDNDDKSFSGAGELDGVRNYIQFVDQNVMFEGMCWPKNNNAKMKEEYIRKYGDAEGAYKFQGDLDDDVPTG